MASQASIEGLDKLEVKLDGILNMPEAGVKVGIVESAKYPLGVMKGRPKRKTAPFVAQVALWNEFGTKGGGWGGPIPERPFMRNTIKEMQKDRNVKELIKESSKAQNAAVRKHFLEAIGVAVKGMMQKTIKDGNFTPNKPATIAIKTNNGKRGSNATPLNDTGVLVRAIDYATWEGTDKDTRKVKPSAT